MKEVQKRRATPTRDDARAANGARRRKRKKRSYTLYYLLLLFFVLISGITLSVTVFFNIETIEVIGSELHSPQEIIQSSGIEKGDNLFRINPQKAEQSLIDAFVDMDAVKISRKFPNRLIIEVTDAVEAYYVSGESGYTVISKGGRILDQNISKESVEGGTEVIGLSVGGMKMGSYFDREKDEAFDLLKRVDDAVATAGLSEITKIDIENPVEMSLTYRDKLLIRLGSITELSYKLNFVKNIIETKLEQDEMGVIDATKAGTIHFIPGDLNSEATSSAQTSSGSTGSDGAGVSSEMTESKETSSGAVQAGSDLTTESDSSLAE